MPKKKEILFAAVDIGWRIEYYTKFIKSRFNQQLASSSFVKYYVPKEHYNTNYTFMYNLHEKNAIVGWLLSFSIFCRSLFRYDIFHFFSGETLLTRKLRKYEFFIYRLFRKKVTMHFVGSDIRSPKYIDWKTKNIHAHLDGIAEAEKVEPWQKKLIQETNKYADNILVSTPDLLSLVPTARYYPVMLDMKKFIKDINEVSYPEKNDRQIVILHAPSNERLKGSEFIYPVLEKIKKESPHDIVIRTPKRSSSSNLTYSVSRYELFKLYKEADIVIDQLIIGWYGLQAIEALVCENQVISFIEPELEKYLFPNCPIQIANVNTLENVITNCIEKQLKKELDFTQHMEWVKKYHTIEENNRDLVHAWGMTNE